MRRQWFFILLSLTERDRHGLGIMRDVLDLTGGTFRLWPVMLYGSLDELREEGWIRQLDAPPSDADDESGRRKWFRITPAGRRALASEVARLDGVVRVAQQRIAHSAGPS